MWYGPFVVVLFVAGLCALVVVWALIVAVLVAGLFVVAVVWSLVPL